MASEDLAGKVAVVTGASAPTGIGAAVARTLADAGAATVLADVDEQQGQALADELRARGARASFIRTDVTDASQIGALIQHSVAEFGSVDIAVNAAARLPDDQPVSSLDEAAWAAILQVNLFGVALSMKYELQQMIRQGRGGVIINISSIRAHKPFPLRSAYVAAKHGLLGLTKTAALENGEHGIRVNAVAPGSIDTPMLRESLDRFQIDAAAYAASVNVFGRFGTPEEVADACLFLAGDRAAVITGSTIHVDGGFAAM